MTDYDAAARRLQAALTWPYSQPVDPNDVRTILAEHYALAAAQARHGGRTRPQRPTPTTTWAIRWNHPDGPGYSAPFDDERWARDCFAACRTGTSVSTTLVVSHDGGPWREVQEGAGHE